MTGIRYKDKLEQVQDEEIKRKCNDCKIENMNKENIHNFILVKCMIKIIKSKMSKF